MKTNRQIKFFAITNEGTQLYELNKTKLKEFHKLFPMFDMHPSDDEHNQALEWIVKNGKYIGECDACCFIY